MLCSRLRFFITSPSLRALGMCHVNTETSFQGLILFLDGLLKEGNISKSIACVAGAKKGGANPLSLFPLFPSPFDVCSAGYKNRRKKRSPRPEKTFWSPPPLSKRLDDSPPPLISRSGSGTGKYIEVLTYATCTSSKFHLICPPKFCITFVFHFS